MLFYTIISIIINLIAVVLSPFTMATGFIFNIFSNSGIIATLRVLTFFFSKSTIIFIISTFIFWTSIFIVRPIVNFIRNKG